MAGNEAEEATVGAHSPQLASRIPSGEHTIWADVSPLLQAACGDLRDGELIHGDNFNLYAAMSALEIMDPKMDSGVICKYYSVDEAIESGAAPIPLSSDSTVDAQRTIDIMDHLLSCEATWHKGHSLAQTVFSCIYLLRPDRTSSHALLHSYCSITRATCKAVIAAVTDARTHEEEDLFIMAYGLPLSGDRDDKCLSMLNAVEETLCCQLRACKSPSMTSRSVEAAESLQSTSDLEEGYYRALLCRLRFRKHYYHVLACMRRPQGRGLELARKHIASCLTELDLIRNSSTFLCSSSLEACKDGLVDKTTCSGRQPLGFDSSLNSRLSAPTPPRAIKLLNWKNAVDYFVKLLHDLDSICSFSLDPFLECVIRFVVQFQKTHPDLVARSLLQFLLVQDGKLFGRDPLYAVITKAAGLPESAKNHEIQKTESIIQLGQLVINLLKVLCTNSAWQRRKLGKILQDWRVIYMQIEMAFKKDFAENLSISNGENACVKIFQHILVWIEEQTYWIATHFLVLGFELELYSPSEYCMVYWYLSVVFIKLVEKIHLKALMSNETGKRKGKKKGASSKDVGRDFRIPPAVTFLQCQICLAEGLVMMLAALRNERMILQTPSPFNTEYERFLQHFDLLQKACIPDNLTFDSYKQSTSLARLSNLVTYNCFKDAQRMAKEVKSSFSNDPEKLDELRRIEQVAEHNSVALNLIYRVGALDPSLKVSFEFNHHPYFGTALVKRS